MGLGPAKFVWEKGANPMKHVYILFGLEAYLLEQKKNEIIRNTLPLEEIEFAVSVHDAREASIQEAIDDCQTLSLVGGKRVVIVKDCYFLTTEESKEKVQHDLDQLYSYLESPNEDTTFILNIPYEKLDGRKKIVKNIKKLANVYEAKPLKGSKLFDWVYDRSRKENISMSTDAINLLMNYIGSNLFQLEQEIVKMALYIGKGHELGVADVEQLVSRTLEQDIFKLINSIMNKEIDQAFEILDDMFKQGEDSIKIINLIARQFRIIFQLKVLRKQGVSNGLMASKLKLHPFVVSSALGMCEQYDLDQLLNILSNLSNLDFKMKTGQIPKELSLETFLTQIA
ncbi:DNA polymerase III subunit delta [Cytobacillus praedii]|uniref:DNA polymerase III subunit delta n=1 Tax=Cytobacillus praedii TaxID=1742358 RepID=UPI002E1E0952|nr:DNA polymerase III subunit delta [Cytobacillus praedii]